MPSLGLGLGINSVRYPGAVDPIPGLSPVMWLKADSLTASENDPIQTWVDSSGNGNDGTQATLAQRPLYKATGINGKPALQFDGVNDWLSVPFTSGVAQYFAVLKSGTATWNNYWGILDSALDIGHEITTRWGIFSQGQAYFHNPPFPAGVRKNGVALVSPFDCGTITSPMVLAVSTANGGANPEIRGIFQLQQSIFGQGTLAELVAFSAIQSAENTAAIEQWLSAKYGII